MKVLAGYLVRMRRLVYNKIFGLSLARHSHLFSVARATHYPCWDNVVMLVAMLIVGINVGSV